MLDPQSYMDRVSRGSVRDASLVGKNMYSSELHRAHPSLLKFPSVLSLISSNLLSSRVLKSLSLTGTPAGYGGSAHRSMSSEKWILWVVTSVYRGGRRRGDDPMVQIIEPGTTADYFLESDRKIQWSGSWSIMQDDRPPGWSLGNRR